MIEAVTFDFWDTLAIDDSDEPKRKAIGLPSKAEARAQLFADWITTHYPHISYEQALEAYHYANRNFKQTWHGEHRTPSIASRIYDAYDYLGLRPPPGKFARLIREVNELIREIEDMEIRVQPDFAPGIHPVLEQLAQHYRLGIISDTIHTTGRGLRYLLQRQGLLRYFKYCVFSDEIGASKPDPAVFYQAAQGLNVPIDRLVHVGDRESNDVEGPLSVGAKAILYTGIIDRGSDRTRAHAVCRHFAELPDIVRRLSAQYAPRPLTFRNA